MERIESIPQIDFGAYGLNVDSNRVTEKELQGLATDVCKALSTVGFIYLKNHGIEEEKIDKSYQVSSSFFKLPEDVKQNYNRGPGLENHGWCCLERERVNPSMQPDHKEAFDINPLQAKAWPQDDVVEGFQETLQGLYDDCRNLAHRILHLMAIGLDLQDPHHFTKLFNRNKATHTALRSLHYPPIHNESDLKENQLRCAEHTDYGAITILFQDEMGGLEVFNRNGYYVPAPPIPGTVVVNLGDLMQRWTADKLISTKHRVLLPKDTSRWKEPRQSIVCFVHPDSDCLVRCIDGSDKYPDVTASDYLEGRFYDTFDKDTEDKEQ